ncbi:ATP-binding protein [Gemmatimonadota bacterium]
MKLPSHARQILLFLLAVLLPCGFLITAGLRVIDQERELAATRLEEQQIQIVHRIGEVLFQRLESVKNQEIEHFLQSRSIEAMADYSDSIVVLVASSVPGGLILPWEETAGDERSLNDVSLDEFEQLIAFGEQEELILGELETARTYYLEALRVAGDASSTAYSQLLLARIESKSDRQEEAEGYYRQILAQPSRVMDKNGLPLAWYAAERLLRNAGYRSTILDCITAEADGTRWFEPAAYYLAAGIIDTLWQTASDDLSTDRIQRVRDEIHARLRIQEQALQLRSFIAARPGPATSASDSTVPVQSWQTFGDPLWLVNATPVNQGYDLVIVADAGKALAAVLQAGSGIDLHGLSPRFLSQWEPDAIDAGLRFRNLWIRLEGANADAIVTDTSARRGFYLGAVLVVIGAALFGGYLLWHDIRRESQLSALRSQFVSNLTHELKTPLTSIRMFAETLASGRIKDSDSHDEYLDTIVGESERLSRLLDNVLDFSKIEQGSKHYRRESTDLAEIVKAAMRTVRYPFQQNGFQLHLHLEEDVPEVLLDADAIKQAVLNLLTNAMKYSGSSRRIDLEVFRSTGYVVVAVRDFGIGIALEDQERIFEKFQRVDSQDVNHVPGTGLGLTVVKHIIEAHGGSVRVESQPGEGSTFALYLPLEAE